MYLTESDGHRMARGSFTVNRLEFGLGQESQPDDGVVGYQITIYFEFKTLKPQLIIR